MTEKFLNIEDRKRIYTEIYDAKVFEEMQQIGSLVKFIDAIFNLHDKPSDDSRFNTLYQSFNKHLIDNYDYDIEEIFLDQFNLLKDDDGETFKRFIIALLDQDYYEHDTGFEKQLYQTVLRILKTLLKPLGWEFVLFSQDENGNVRYKLQELSFDHTDTIPPNTIPIHFVTSRYNSSYSTNHDLPSSGAVLLMVFDMGWDDFGVATKATLYYYDEYIRCHKIGDVKILYKDETTEEMGSTDIYSTKNYIKESTFKAFNANFCSLGQELKYYSNLQKLFKTNDEWLSILLALRDTAYFSSIYEKFSNTPQWHSLVREQAAQDILQTARPMLHGVDLESMYDFSYRFIPPYSEDEEISINFKFDNPISKIDLGYEGKTVNSLLSRRIYGIIGKNGVGKTHFLTTIPKDIATGHLTSFSGQIPLFRKVITVSNSYYDHFDIPEPSLNFNYVYCGHLKLDESGKRILKTRSEFFSEIVQNGKKISSLLKCKQLKKALQDILPSEFIKSCFVSTGIDRLDLVEESILIPQIERLSSGEASLVHIFFSLVANVVSGTLILFDEPETHLHPNAITSLFNSLQQLCEDANAYAIVATHSPLVIREIRSECVFIFSRDENSCTVSKINYESFGASIDHLTEDIFGNREVPKSYIRIIKELIDDSDTTEDEVIKTLSNGNLPLGLGLRLYIHQLFSKHKNA